VAVILDKRNKTYSRNNMLKGIPNILSPELLKVLMEMGHGDEIVIADGNFPPLLEAIVQFFPLDTFVKQPVTLMAVVPGDNYSPDIWPVYESIIRKFNPRFNNFEMLNRFEFYDRAKKAYAIVTTGEMARYANIILKKGII